MQTLSFGFQKPETGDRGPVVFPALEANIQQLNDHTHDGTDSAKINSSSILPLSVVLAAGSWVPEADGQYSQIVTLPASLTYDDTTFCCHLGTDGHVVYPTIEKIDSGQFKVFTNDNSQGLRILYI